MQFISVLITAFFNTLTILLYIPNRRESFIVGLPSSNDMNILLKHRILNIQQVSAVSSAASLNRWKTTLDSNNTWPDIDMTSGCKARHANWPAADHLVRVRSLASAYVNNTQDITSFNIANVALTYWFNHDFTSDDCVVWGGVPNRKCPCSTPGLWNGNWFDQVIMIPKLISDICLLLKDELTAYQKDKCISMQQRAVARLGHNLIHRALTGANLLDVSFIGIGLALFKEDASLLQNTLTWFYNGVFINPKATRDGIQADGSFMQHNGMLYNGNYGKDYINDVLAVMTAVKGTSLEPPAKVQEAFELLMSGTEWMIMADTKLNKLLWQYSPIGRMVSLRYADEQSSGGVAIDINKVVEVSQGWNDESEFEDIVHRLKETHTDGANQGDLIGTRYFYNAEYMVHRTPNYVTTMKMYSTRTLNTECVNIENPYGFHLSDGVIYNYLTGDEYVDVFGSWNWELVPGITVDMGTTKTPDCHTQKTRGKKSFVGGATDGNTGIAVMDYLNPYNGMLSFKKAAFFFPSAYAIQLSSVKSRNTSAPLVTVLDQRKRNGDIYVSGQLRNTGTAYDALKASSIWHDKIGYYFPTTPENLHVDSTPRNANWSRIGFSQGTEKQQLWTSYIDHTNKDSGKDLLTQYIVQPNIEQNTFQDNIENERIPIALDYRASTPHVSAAYSVADATIAVAFWTAGAYVTPWKSTTITSDQPCVLLLRQIDAETNAYNLTVADPSQLLQTTIKIEIKISLYAPKVINVVLPRGNIAGKAIVHTFTI